MTSVVIRWGYCPSEEPKETPAAFRVSSVAFQGMCRYFLGKLASSGTHLAM